MPSSDPQGGPRARRPTPRAAWVVAIVADLVQLVAFPFFGEGVFSPVNDALDVLVSIVLLRLLGWHVALLPALAAELVPVLDLVPTWTLAVAVVSFSRRDRPGDAAIPPRAAGPTASHAEIVEDAPPTLPGASEQSRD